MTDSEPTHPDSPPTPPAADWTVPFLAGWVLLAALSQIGYLAGWPMYLYGVAVWGPAAILVVLLRLGVYGGIGIGLLAGDPSAWAAATLEFTRTFIACVIVFPVQGWTTGGPLYPAPWLQGLLSAVMPLLLGCNVALSRGWRPGTELDPRADAAARVLMAISLLAALALRRRANEFNVTGRSRVRALLSKGIPLLAPLWLLEGVAVWLALRHP